MSESGALDGGMTVRAKADQIGQLIGLLPIIVKFAPGRDVVNVQRMPKFLLGDSTFLTGMIVSLYCLEALGVPVWAAPLVVSALPVAMVLALLPSGSAFIRAKASILSAFDNMSTYLDLLAALTTSKQCVSSFIFAFTATEAHIDVSIAIAVHCKWFSANLTDKFNPVALGGVGTFLGAKAVNLTIAIVGEWFSAMLTGLRRVADRFAIALARAKVLAPSMGLELFSADLTGFHTLMIPQLDQCVKIRFAGG